MQFGVFAQLLLWPPISAGVKGSLPAASEFEGHEVDQEAHYLEDAVFESDSCRSCPAKK